MTYLNSLEPQRTQRYAKENKMFTLRTFASFAVNKLLY